MQMVKLHLNSLPMGVITLEPLFSNFVFQMAAHEEDFLDNVFSCTHNKRNIFFPSLLGKTVVGL